jgi:hypothetical protein
MRARNAGFTVAGILFLSGCAATDVANKATLNERSDRMAFLEDHRPPNPNQPRDNRELKSTAPIVQQDPALNKPSATADRDDKGLVVNAGADKFIRQQDPTQTDEAPQAAGGPALQSRSETVSSADSALVGRVKEAIAKLPKGNSNTDPQVTSKETNGENKGMPNIQVTAKNGVVTLNGSVNTDADRTAFEQAASRTAGVQSVNNYLTVTKTK